MKKIISIILFLLLIFSLSACESQGDLNRSEADGKLKIVATIFPPYDFARQIAKDKADLKMLLPTGAESHSYEPTLDDIAAIQECDIFIYSGGGTDSFGSEILETLDTSQMEIICLMDETQLLHNHSEDESSHEHETAENDEHVWTSPKNAVKFTNCIAEAIIKKDPKNAVFYEENLASYINELTQLDELFKKTVEEGKLDCIAFADRFPFLYLAEEYGLRHFEALDGCSSDTEPTLTALNDLVENIKKEDIGTVFYIEFSGGTVADKVCKLTGADKLLFHSCHNLSKEETEEGETYLSLMQKNAARLKTALK